MVLRGIIVVFLWSAAFASAATAATPKRAEDVFVLSAARAPDGALQLTWKIDAGHYLYRDNLAATVEDGRPLSLATAVGETKDDPNFGMTEVYHDVASGQIAADQLPAAGSVRVTFRGCAEQGICYPLVTESVDLATLAIGRPRAVSPWADIGSPPRQESEPAPDRPMPVLERSAGANPARPTSPALLSGSLPLVLASFLGFGVLLALTPCVFPMIPTLSGMLARSGERLSAGRAFVLSGAYALAMGLAYAALGAGAAWSGQNLQIALQTPLALGATAAVFLALALSMFGLFDLQLPSALAARFNRRSSRAGSLAGAVALGFGSALIVGPCVTPPLAAALLYVGATGDIVRGGLALFALGLGMGLPLVAFGTLGGGLLPKSGPWLVGVKQAFGYVFVLLAVSMIARVLPANAGVGLWGASAIVLSASLISSPGAIAALARPVGALGMVCGAILLVGFAAGATDPLRPLAVFANADQVVRAAEAHTIDSLPAFETALAEARGASRPILVDFTAEWCTTCKDIDRDVLSEVGIRRRLEKVAVLRVDVTTQSAGLQQLMDRFGVVGPPTMFLLDPRTGAEIAQTRSIGELSVGDFAAMLARAGA